MKCQQKCCQNTAHFSKDTQMKIDEITVKQVVGWGFQSVLQVINKDITRHHPPSLKPTANYWGNSTYCIPHIWGSLKSRICLCSMCVCLGWYRFLWVCKLCMSGYAWSPWALPSLHVTPGSGEVSGFKSNQSVGPLHQQKYTKIWKKHVSIQLSTCQDTSDYMHAWIYTHMHHYVR